MTDEEQRLKHELWLAEYGALLMAERKTPAERDREVRAASQEVEKAYAELKRVSEQKDRTWEGMVAAHGRVSSAFEKLGRLLHFERESTHTHSAWVLHSPYPDGTWRGVEKCVTTSEEAAVLLFNQESEAWAYAEEQELVDMIPVRCLLTTPAVRQPMSAVPVGDFDDWILR